MFACGTKKSKNQMEALGKINHKLRSSDSL